MSHHRLQRIKKDFYCYAKALFRAVLCIVKLLAHMANSIQFNCVPPVDEKTLNIKWPTLHLLRKSILVWVRQYCPSLQACTKKSRADAFPAVQLKCGNHKTFPVWFRWNCPGNGKISLYEHLLKGAIPFIRDAARCRGSWWCRKRKPAKTEGSMETLRFLKECFCLEYTLCK